MHGVVLNKELGEGGFGYDPMFIPNGFDKTLGELGYDAKKEFSHRTKALDLAKKVLDVVL
jgi:XTP/dITP diphosphohydrolase